ncbi:MAG: chromate efflux transporter [Betaproteobacteria bacterium]|nr:chromate efflux transporter [Betaproteobacteria bacterium]
MKIFELFLTFLRLGLTSFGGPVAHLGYFHEAFVRRKKWLSESRYADIVALCQVLPGPASSQVGMSIGLMRGGVRGAVAAWLGFTLPSALLMILLALFTHNLQPLVNPAVLRGLKLAAVVVVIHALVAMARSLCPDVKRKLLALVVAAPLVFWNHPGLQILLIALGGFVGARWLPESSVPAGNSACAEDGGSAQSTDSASGAAPAHSSEIPAEGNALSLSGRTGLLCLSLLAFLLIALPMLSAATGNIVVSLFDKLFRTGTLIFGGGHVVLPLLASEFLEQKWISHDIFLAGYGAAQALPGPLFSFAGFLGATSLFEHSAAAVPAQFFTEANGIAAMHAFRNGLPWLGGVVALIAVFLPSFLIVFGVLPFWQRLKEFHWMRRALTGVNAAVVGLLLAALIHPVGSTAIKATSDVVIVLTGLGLMFFGRAPSWSVVLLCALLARFSA